MIYLSSERIFWGKRRLVLPILVNERLAQVFFRSGAYISNNHFAKLSFSHIRCISMSLKGVPCSTCHLARLVRDRGKKKKIGHYHNAFQSIFKIQTISYFDGSIFPYLVHYIFSTNNS